MNRTVYQCQHEHLDERGADEILSVFSKARSRLQLYLRVLILGSF